MRVDFELCRPALSFLVVRWLSQGRKPLCNKTIINTTKACRSGGFCWALHSSQLLLDPNQLSKAKVSLSGLCQPGPELFTSSPPLKQLAVLALLGIQSIPVIKQKERGMSQRSEETSKPSSPFTRFLSLDSLLTISFVPKLLSVSALISQWTHVCHQPLIFVFTDALMSGNDTSMQRIV